MSLMSSLDSACRSSHDMNSNSTSGFAETYSDTDYRTNRNKDGEGHGFDGDPEITKSSILCLVLATDGVW